MTAAPRHPYAFRPRERVRKRSQYLRIQGSGRKLHSDSFLVFLARAEGGVTKRIGITVSKKVGNAVERNRIKRLVREVWRHRKAAFPAGFDVVLVAKRSAVALDFRRADQEIERLCSRHLSHL